MGRHIDGHAPNIGGKVGAVIEIEPAQEILVGLAVTRMLGNDQAGHHFQRLAGTENRHAGQTLTGDHALTTRCRNPFQILRLGPDLDG